MLSHLKSGICFPSNYILYVYYSKHAGVGFWTVANDNVPDWQQFLSESCFTVCQFFITVFTTNLVLWCSVQLVLLWKQLSSVLQRRFPLWLAQILWFRWCDDGSCKVVPRRATSGFRSSTHIGFCLLTTALILFLTAQLKRGSQGNLLLVLARCVLWRVMTSSIALSRILLFRKILFVSDIWAENWGGSCGGQNKRVVFSSLSNNELWF